MTFSKLLRIKFGSEGGSAACGQGDGGRFIRLRQSARQWSNLLRPSPDQTDPGTFVMCRGYTDL